MSLARIVLIYLACILGFVLMLWGIAPARAQDCPETHRYDTAEAYIFGEVEAGRVTGLILPDTTEEVDAMIAHINVTYGRAIPLGTADRGIGFVNVKSGKFFFFGYRDKCQVGYVILDGPPPNLDAKPMSGRDA